MIKSMMDSEREAALRVADLMVTAAITAPKGSGKDTVRAAVLTGDDKKHLAEIMRQIGTENKEEFYLRDADNIDSSHCIVIIGCISKSFGLPNCGNCGFKNCAEMEKAGARCAFNVTDLGIAIGSAVSIAADNRIDNRVLYSAGKAANRLAILDDVNLYYGIPLSTTSKSIFFDRNPEAVSF
ncbi:MAG: ferredoxin [Peptostreptococcaceae bacterium]|nr:ferredoxin [Peptostreptococcaceae bacterium]